MRALTADRTNLGHIMCNETGCSKGEVGNLRAARSGCVHQAVTTYVKLVTHP